MHMMAPFHFMFIPVLIISDNDLDVLGLYELILLACAMEFASKTNCNYITKFHQISEKC